MDREQQARAGMMESSGLAHDKTGGGLLWGIDFGPQSARDITLDTPRAPGSFRWLHFSLADNATRRWVEQQSALPPPVREALVAHESWQNSFVDGNALSCVLQDLQRDFEVRHTDRVGALHVALLPDTMITARLHPLGFSDILRRRLADNPRITGPERALDLLVSAIIANHSQLVEQLSAQVQKAEDAVLAGHAPPESRKLLDIRRRLAIIHRMIEGMQRVFLRLEDDEDLAPAMHPTVEKLSQRMQALDEDVLGIQAQVRALRDELELASNQRINRNLYILSVMTVLLMPATLVTGFFGMNTGGLPFTHGWGTALAGLVAGGASAATFVYLRSKDFF